MPMFDLDKYNKRHYDATCINQLAFLAIIKLERLAGAFAFRPNYN